MSEENSTPKKSPLFTTEFKIQCVKISKLLCEAWLDVGQGKEFKQDINKNTPLDKALENQGISAHTDFFLRYQLDTSTYNGSLVPEEILTEGLNFVWYIPYGPRPTEASLSEEEIEDWIAKAENWIDQMEKNPDPNTRFPVPNNPYIPLATS